MIAKLIGFFYLTYLARQISLVDFGWYTLALAYADMVMEFVSFGINRVILRDGGRDTELVSSLVKAGLVARGLLVIAGISVFWIITFNLNYPPVMQRLLLLVGVSILMRGVERSFTAGFQALEKMWLPAAFSVVTSIISPAVGIWLLFRGYGVEGVMVGIVSAQAFEAVLLVYLASRRGWFADLFVDTGTRLRQLFAQSWPFAVLSSVSFLVFRIDAAMLSKLVAPQELGLYLAAYKLVELGVIVPVMLNIAVFPLFSRLVVEDKPKLGRLFITLTIILGAASLIGIGVVYLTAQPLIVFIFGADFAQAAPVMVILAVALALIIINSLPAPIIQSSRYLKRYLPMVFFLLLINIGLNIWLIPDLGISGAAWATVGTELVGLAINTVFIKKIL